MTKERYTELRDCLLKRSELDLIKDYLENKKIFIVSQDGWYYGWNYMGFFDTREEALAFLDMTEEEYKSQKRATQDDFWYFCIDEISLLECFLKVLEQEKKDAIFEAKKEIKKTGNEWIYKAGYFDAKRAIEKQIENVFNNL